MVNIFTLLMVLCCSLLVSGCGVYGFRGNNPPAGINSVAIPTFRDVSGFSAPTLAEDFTQRLKNKIIGDGTFRVADKNTADANLICTISNVRDEAVVISSGENVARRKLTITVLVVFENLKTQKKIWEKNFENYGEYNSSNESFSERADGISMAVEKISEDILIDLTSNW
ncbi:MAG: LPS assembly lipoprotein LptE [Bacteroidota bacterium]|nr:LPS assembly lipoprotein LptE [Bacteroidota bacterium]